METIILSPDSQTIESDQGRLEIAAVPLAETAFKTTILEALAEETTAISLDRSHRSTQAGNNVDFEDD